MTNELREKWDEEDLRALENEVLGRTIPKEEKKDFLSTVTDKDVEFFQEGGDMFVWGGGVLEIGL